MAAIKNTSRSPKILSPELLDGSFIEETITKTGATEYRIFFPKPIMRTRAMGELGRDKHGAPTQDLALKLDGEKLQNFFGLVIQKAVADGLNDKLPYIKTGSDVENRVTLLKFGIRRFHDVREAKARAQEFFTQYPEIKTVIADQGYVIDTGYASIPRVLLVPPSELEKVETAFRTAAPEAFLRRRHMETDNACLRAEGLEITHPFFEEIINQLVPKERVASSFKGKVMESLASTKPEAAELIATINEKPELVTILNNKAYFYVRSSIFSNTPPPGVIVFAEEKDASRCLELLHTIPGFEAAKLVGANVHYGSNFPRIDLSDCDPEKASFLSGFAGEVTVTNKWRSQEQKFPRRSSSMSFLEELMRADYPDHPVFVEQSKFTFR